MTDFKNRVIYVPKDTLIGDNPSKLHDNLISLIHTVNYIDKDVFVKKSCEKVNLSTSSLKSMKDQSITSFHQDVLDTLEDINKVKFLIFNN